MSARLLYQAETDRSVRWTQVIVDGQIQTWERGEVSDPDVEIRWSLDHALDILAGRLSGTEATAVTTIVEHRPDGTYVGPPPPLDLARQPEISQLPTLPGVNLVFHQELRRAPFGTTQASSSFLDGRLVEMGLGLIGDPDVAIKLPFRAAMRLRRGEISTPDALYEGRIRGSIGSMTVLSGLLESLPYQRAMAACAAGPAPAALATLGEVVAQRGYRRAMSSLMDDTVVVALR